MKVQLAVVEWQPRGWMLVLDDAREGMVAYGPSPYVEVQGDPLRVVWCHPLDQRRVREALNDDPDVQLVE